LGGLFVFVFIKSGGFQTRECLEGFGMADVADQLAQSGLLGE
jgi:hypothetical protein